MAAVEGRHLASVTRCKAAKTVVTCKTIYCTVYMYAFLVLAFSFEKSEVYEETNVIVFHEGKVLWVPKVTFYTFCSRDAHNSGSFNCTLK